MRYVISDIHGEYELFLELMAKIGFSDADEIINGVGVDSLLSEVAYALGEGAGCAVSFLVLLARLLPVLQSVRLRASQIILMSLHARMVFVLLLSSSSMSTAIFQMSRRHMRMSMLLSLTVRLTVSFLRSRARTLST
jgi:hypothetical protein